MYILKCNENTKIVRANKQILQQQMGFVNLYPINMVNTVNLCYPDVV